MNLLSYLYTAFLYLYPAAFRQEFAAEMQAVFAEAMEAAYAKGGLAPFRLFVHEVADLPGNLLHLHWKGLDLLPFDSPDLDPWANLPGTRRAALLAGVPHLIYPLSIYLPIATSIFLGLRPASRPSLFPFWILTAALLLFSWSRGWPRWSSSWVGYGLVLLLDRLTVYFPTGWLSQVTIMVWFFAVLWIILRLARRDWLSGLLAVLPIAPMWVWWIGIRGDAGILSSAMLYTSIGFSFSLAVAVIVRIGRWQTAVLLLLALFLAIGHPASSFMTYHGILAFNNLSDPLEPANGGLSNYLLLLLLTAPLWLLALWRQVQQRR